MPRWMYGVLGLAIAWLVWTQVLKPAPNISQMTTQQGVQINALGVMKAHFVCFLEDYNLGRVKLNFHQWILLLVWEIWQIRRSINKLMYHKVIVGITGV